MSFYTFGSDKKPGFIYIGLPKTASTSIQNITEYHYYGIEVHRIGHVGVDHSSLDGIDLPRIICVRNPYDRMVSAFQHMYKVHETLGDERLPPAGQKGFNRFVKYVYAHDLSWKNMSHDLVQIAKQGSPVTEYHKATSFKRTQLDNMKKNGELVDFELVMKYENLQEDYKKFQDFIKCDKPLPHDNAGTLDLDYREIYTRHTKELVTEMFAEDLEYFNYSF